MAVVHIHPPNSAGHLASYAHKAVALDHGAASDDDVLGRGGEPPGILVAAGFQYHGIISLVKDTVFDDGTAGHLDIDAVVVVAVGIHVEAVHPGILAQVQMNGPERTFPDFEAVKGHVGAAVELDQMGPHIGLPFFHAPVLHGNSGRAHRVELASGLDMLFGSCEPRAPEVHLGGDGAAAGDAHILASESIYEGRVVHAFGAFPGGMDGGKIQRRVVFENQSRAFAKVEETRVLEVYCPCNPFSLRDYHPSASGLVAGLHCLFESFHRGFGVVFAGAVAGNRKVPCGEVEHLQRLEREGSLVRADFVCGGAKACKQKA